MIDNIRTVSTESTELYASPSDFYLRSTLLSHSKLQEKTSHLRQPSSVCSPGNLPNLTFLRSLHLSLYVPEFMAIYILKATVKGFA